MFSHTRVATDDLDAPLEVVRVVVVDSFNRPCNSGAAAGTPASHLEAIPDPFRPHRSRQRLKGQVYHQHRTEQRSRLSNRQEWEAHTPIQCIQRPRATETTVG